MGATKLTLDCKNGALKRNRPGKVPAFRVAPGEVVLGGRRRGATLPVETAVYLTRIDGIAALNRQGA
jgi:hypothetical protein